MKRFLSMMMTVCLSASLLVVPASCADTGTETIRVGLYYNTAALSAPQLQNYQGSGYQAGYYDSGKSFHSLYPISEKKTAILKDANYVAASDGTYAEGTSGETNTVGAYHVQLPESYRTADAARAAAQTAGTGAFVCYLGATYYVRQGQYPSLNAAQTAASASGGSAVGASDTGITVVATGTNTILFEYDGDQTFAMAPQGDHPLTWFKGYKYYGNFAYFRKDGGNLSVINYVPLEDYVKGVIPYEMSPDWNVEALKAQAVCARSFVENEPSKYTAQGFDVSNTVDCQVYKGANQATENSDTAVDETAGQTLSYDGKPVVGYYFSADGGATEDASNVWGGDYAYLKGVEDPYENTEAAQNGIWSVTLTAAQIGTKLKTAGYSIGTVAAVSVTNRTAMDNVLTVTVTDTTGTTVILEKGKTRTVFGLNSQRYTVSGNASGSSSTQETASLGSSILSGAKAAMSGEKLSSGTAGSGTAGAVSTSFTFDGRGWGHQVGMSQYGAKAMADAGKTYDQILKVY
ncbi:MAG: SpoIID/LytB domain-containing protein, partial [Intestinibacillus sp.]